MNAARTIVAMTEIVVLCASSLLSVHFAVAADAPASRAIEIATITRTAAQTTGGEMARLFSDGSFTVRALSVPGHMTPMYIRRGNLSAPESSQIEAFLTDAAKVGGAHRSTADDAIVFNLQAAEDHVEWDTRAADLPAPLRRLGDLMLRDVFRGAGSPSAASTSPGGQD